ncbi:gamma-glutamyl-gamma-aminobutyrate hydrolase family protein [Schaalia sp. ZJ405]|uniref:glutamine amidotransferase-related protein n=1 Tax=Schaalia sp. ZJ405 TaxID=2709403 RepID=UPI0013EC2EEB|nr:gamma-glutamyl-gamma-aminobutyrate hydrolase family protein [Schaalia sp. ZJ405]QPK80735.1 gamma-glutamyl-gamma-aminobutyrate hydrolase family protein [Schaalia sp. ZJ405]
MPTKPFLVLTSRPNGPVVDSELHALPRLAGLHEDEWAHLRLESATLPEITLEDWSGVFVCGSPWDSSADPAHKSPEQLRGEAWLSSLYDQALASQFPIFGICYGLGTLNLHLGGMVTEEHGEEMSSVLVTVTQEGRKDPILSGVPDIFGAYVGHHEAVSQIGHDITVLATGEAAPVQMVRVGEAAWATQFHPELDREGMDLRIEQYAGIYSSEANSDIIRERAYANEVGDVHQILRNFVELHRR